MGTPRKPVTELPAAPDFRNAEPDTLLPVEPVEAPVVPEVDPQPEADPETPVVPEVDPQPEADPETPVVPEAGPVEEDNPEPVVNRDETVYDDRGNVRPAGTPGAVPMDFEQRVAIAAQLAAGPDMPRW